MTTKTDLISEWTSTHYVNIMSANISKICFFILKKGGTMSFINFIDERQQQALLVSWSGWKLCTQSCLRSLVFFIVLAVSISVGKSNRSKPRNKFSIETESTKTFGFQIRIKSKPGLDQLCSRFLFSLFLDISTDENAA